MALSLSKFSIQKQILIGYAPVFIILAFLAFSSFQNFESFNRSFISLQDITKENLVFLEIERDVVELQRNVLVYSYVGYKGVLRKVEFLQTQLEDKFKIIEPIANQDEEIKDRFNRMVGHYQDYKKGFNEVVKENQYIDDLTHKNLSPLFEKNQKILNEIIGVLAKQGNFEMVYKVSQIKNDLLQAHFNIDLFKKYPDAELIDFTRMIISRMEEAGEGLKSNLSDINLVHKVDNFLKTLSEYKNTFTKIITVNQIYLHLINVVLAGRAAEIDKLSNELDKLVSQRSQDLSSRIKKNINTTQSQFSIFSLIAGFIGFLSSVFIAMGIASPVRAMAKTLSELSKGKPDVEIPGQARMDEVGQMAKAAHAFKTMTERIEIQNREIKEKQAQLSAIVDNMVDGIITIDGTGTILNYNNACERIFGFSANTVLGQNVKMLMPEPYHSEHDSYIQNYHRTRERKIIGMPREVLGKRENGTVFPMDLSVSHINLEGRKLYSGIVRDITYRKEQQQALVNANAELEEFAYRTSHDLRSPLVSSISLLNLAEEAINENDYEKAKTSIGFVNLSLAKLEALIKDILELTKTKSIQEDTEEINFEQMIDESLEKLLHMDNYQRLNIEKYLKFDGKLNSKRSRIALVIENLISNAIKYQDTKKKTPFVKISTYTDNGNIVLEIEDNGLGIPKNQQDNLFSMFKRFHPKVSFGSGLGLYMMKKSADVLGGEIVFVDTGQGSIFKLIIPNTTQH